MEIKAIILDFDGTIIESVGIKDLAFETMFRKYPEHFDEIMRYHLSHNAVIRFDKFRYITENILGQKYDEEIEKGLSREYSQLIFKQIVECPYVAGWEEFLDFFYGRVQLYLVTINPADEFDRTIKSRNLKKYFKNIYAVPGEKEKVINDILGKENLSSGKVVFIGDSFEDYQAAQATNVFFVGRDSGKSFYGAEIPIFKDFFEIKNFLLAGAIT